MSKKLIKTLENTKNSHLVIVYFDEVSCTYSSTIVTYAEEDNDTLYFTKHNDDNFVIDIELEHLNVYNIIQLTNNDEIKLLKPIALL